MDDGIENPAVVAKLHPTIRCATLVGYFLQCWAVLESTLNRAIVDALDLGALQGAVVTKNIQLRDKLNILKTLVDMQSKEVERYKKMLETIGTLSHDRNMMAHDAFLADNKGDGVQFIVVKAKGKLVIPPTRWSIADFYKKYLDIMKITDDAEKMADELSNLTLSKFLKKLSTTPAQPQLGLLNSLLHPPPGLPHSTQTQATPETGDEKPPSPDQE